MDADLEDDDAYKEFLASHSETENEEEDDDVDKIEEYRQKLLGGLSGDREESDRELDVKFNVGFGEDLGKKILKDKKEKEEKEEETAWEKYQRKRKEKKKLKNEQKKQKKEEVVPDREEKNLAELELLVSKKDKKNFEANTEDKRF